ncbi:MAG: HNH endonuclease [Pseudonocardiaceae bacterium]
MKKGPVPQPWLLTFEEVRRRYEGREALSALATACGLRNYGTIAKRLREAGVEIRRRGAPPGRMPSCREKGLLHLDPEEIRRLAASGLSAAEMSQQFGCSSEPVRRMMVRHDIARLPSKARTAHNVFWRGGYHVDKHGYILVRRPQHIAASRAGYVRGHRLVKEAILGRVLTDKEVVDHRDGDTSNNDPENLVLYQTNGMHLRATRTGRLKLPANQREKLRREAVRRACQRVETILAVSKSDAGQLPLWWPHPSTEPRINRQHP